MAKTSEDLRDEVLALPAEDRARIAADLLASLDHERSGVDEVDRLWAVETERRAALLESGEARLVSWDEVLEAVDQRRAQRQV